MSVKRYILILIATTFKSWMNCYTDSQALATILIVILVKADYSFSSFPFLSFYKERLGGVLK